MFELAVRLTEAMQRGLGERGLSASRAEVLLVLHKGGPMVQRQLGDSLRCTPRYVTTLVDALEAEGLVRRRAHPTDRRATLVSLTARGTAAANKMDAERVEAARWLLGDVPATDLATFVAIADQVLERVSAAGPPPPSARDQPSVTGGAPGSRPRSRAPGRTPAASKHAPEKRSTAE